MKKNLFGLLAVVVAIASVAFTTPKEDRFANVFFSFTGSVSSPSEVQDEANKWVEVSDIGMLLCNNVHRKACRIAVDALNTTGTAPNRKIDPSKVSIVAQLYSPESTYFVSTTSTNVTQIRDKQ